MSMPHLMDPIHLSVVGDNSSERGADLAGYGVVLLSCSKGYVEKAEGRSQFTMRQAVLKMKRRMRKTSIMVVPLASGLSVAIVVIC